MLAPLVSEISGRWQAVLQTARAAEVFNLALGGEDRFQGCPLRVQATSDAPGRRCPDAVDSRSPSGPDQGEGVADACRLDLAAGPKWSLGLPVRWG